MKNKGEIKSWSPFFASYVGYDKRHNTVVFECPECGSDSLRRPHRGGFATYLYFSRKNVNIKHYLSDPYFFQGSFECVKCNQQGFNYYSDCFKTTTMSLVQLSLFD